MRRFQRAVRSLERGHLRGLTGLALSCGYYDHAHFHDFRAFAGFTPSEYLERRRDLDRVRDHVPLA